MASKLAAGISLALAAAQSGSKAKRLSLPAGGGGEIISYRSLNSAAKYLKAGGWLAGGACGWRSAAPAACCLHRLPGEISKAAIAHRMLKGWLQYFLSAG